MHAESHYSDQTLARLIESHGWTPAARGNRGEIQSVARRTCGHWVLAGYRDDPTRRRYIQLSLGDAFVLDIDGRDKSPVDVARAIDQAAFEAAEKAMSHWLAKIEAGARVACA